MDWDALAEEGVIAPQDTRLFRYCETAEEGWARVQGYWSKPNAGTMYNVGPRKAEGEEG